MAKIPAVSRKSAKRRLTRPSKLGPDVRLEREFGRLLDLCGEQRARCERAMKAQPNDYPDPKLAAMLAALSRLVLDAMHERRQLQKQSTAAAAGMSEVEAFQALVDAGWKPPKGWVPPQGVQVR